MSVKSANLWSKIVFLLGCGAFVALLTADIESYAATGSASLPFGLHGQAIVFIVMTTTCSAFVQVAIWRMRHQAAQYRSSVKAIVIDVVGELAPSAEPQTPEGVVQLPAPETVAAVKRLASKVVNNAH